MQAELVSQQRQLPPTVPGQDLCDTELQRIRCVLHRMPLLVPILQRTGRRGLCHVSRGFDPRAEQRQGELRAK